MAGQMVVGGLFNAGFLFSKLNHSGYSEEMHRHNEAMEKLSKAREKFYEEEVKSKNRLEELEREIQKAGHDFNETNQYLDEYRKMKSNYSSWQKRKPVLSDYYQPSSEIQHYEELTKAGMAIGSGALLFDLL